ncbi:hypothetical protein BOX15_Mlig014137g1 [Macrostomum lignano]|uniref:Uncharacterized protein n=1 Tax=Macrostomum lignano TaxID=282301 RepID=A0A267DXG3_9PLAT|nr:hypothetical protein BOX15_Mlig014137g2 [Macrostomum lignano]PAA53991.1 hypothetical protein BOX15_Mlig014137g1 [Macrostomum lignano]
MKNEIFGLLLLAAIVASEPFEGLTEEEMELKLKPCLVYNINCPADGSMGNYKEMKKELEMMKVGIKLQGGRTPPECTECGRGERCDRECYYALLKVAVLELPLVRNQNQQRFPGKRSV